MQTLVCPSKSGLWLHYTILSISLRAFGRYVLVEISVSESGVVIQFNSSSYWFAFNIKNRKHFISCFKELYSHASVYSSFQLFSYLNIPFKTASNEQLSYFNAQHFINNFEQSRLGIDS